MYDLWVSFKRVPIIYESYVFVYTMSEHLPRTRTNISSSLHVFHFLYHFVVVVFLCMCVFSIFACIVGKACLFWLTNKIFKFEFEFVL